MVTYRFYFHQSKKPSKQKTAILELSGLYFPFTNDIKYVKTSLDEVFP